MADFDIHSPSPDAGHEAIRVAVVEAIEELGYNTGDLAVSFELTDLLFVLLDQALTAVDDLSARVAALESPFVPDPPEE